MRHYLFIAMKSDIMVLFLFMSVWRARGGNRNYLVFQSADLLWEKVHILDKRILFAVLQSPNSSETCSKPDHFWRWFMPQSRSPSWFRVGEHCMVPTLFARGACVDEEWVAESPGLRRSGLWWGRGEGMPSKAEVGAWIDCQECGLGSTARGHRSRNHAHQRSLGASTRCFLVSPSCKLKAQEENKQTNKQKTMAFSPVLAKRGLNLELTLPIWPQLRPATIQNIHRQQNRPRHWLQCLLKFQGYINSFQRFLTVSQQALPQDLLNQNFFFFFNLIRNCWGCVLVLKKAPSWFQCTIRF